MSQMIAVQIAGPGGALEVVKRPVPEPGPNRVRIKIQACGVCHSDVFAKDGHWPGLVYPRVTGHEVAGVIDAVGPGVTNWKKGQRAGVGWHGGHCGHCVPCRNADFMGCQNFQVTGFNEDGGYAQYMIARSEAVAAIPDALSSVEAAPILCAGITTFNSLRHSGARAGDLVAVQGLGGLGHLGVQFASKWGITRWPSAEARIKRPWPSNWGRHATSIRKPSTRQKNLPTWAEPPSSLPPHRAAKP